MGSITDIKLSTEVSGQRASVFKEVVDGFVKRVYIFYEDNVGNVTSWAELIMLKNYRVKAKYIPSSNVVERNNVKLSELHPYIQKLFLNEGV